MTKEDLIKKWEQRARDFLKLSKLGSSAPEHHAQLHQAAIDQKARAETYAECAKQLRDYC